MEVTTWKPPPPRERHCPICNALNRPDAESCRVCDVRLKDWLAYAPKDEQ